jgi:hypothetical protein
MPTAYYFLVQTVVETPMYLRAAKAFLSEAEREEIILTIAADPEAGDLMPGTGGYRKLRFARRGMANVAARVSFISMAVRIFRSSSSRCMRSRRRAI